MQVRIHHNLDLNIDEQLKWDKPFTGQQRRELAARQYKTKFTLMDLVTVFMDEAYKICKDRTMANSIALDSLRDYIKKHVNNINVIF